MVLEQGYFRPETLDEAVELLDNYGAEAKILAGGTDLIVNLRDNMTSCKYLIDIKGISEMKKIKYWEDSGLAIGGAVCINDIIQSKVIEESYPILISAGKALGNYLLRNRATMMGNICNASPAGDMLAPALVLDGVIEAFSVEGFRYIPLKDFFLGVKKNELMVNELAVRILIPPVKGKGEYIRKSRIKGHDLAQIAVAGFIKDSGGLKLSLAAAAPVPVLIDEFNKITKEDLKDERLKGEIIDKVMSSINPIGDQRASREYRLAMAQYLTSEVLEALAKEV